jgi:hypothetical protein
MWAWDTWNLIPGLDFIWRNYIWIQQITSTANDNNLIPYFNHKLILRLMMMMIMTMTTTTTTITITTTITLTIYVVHKLYMSKTYLLPEDGQQLRPKHAGALINKWKKLCNKLVLNLMYSLRCLIGLATKPSGRWI